jgi:HAD superfamily hydrolase (TIGR01509 family)
VTVAGSPRRGGSVRGRSNPAAEGKIRGVLFDMDGTIVSVPYDWPRIKAELGSGDVPILSYLDRLGEPEQSRKNAVLERHEAEATRRAILRQGTKALLGLLAARGAKTALITNNSRTNTEHLLERFRLTFDLVMTRESGLWKPSGAPLLAVMEKLGLTRNACCAVGDSHFDVSAAKAAGIPLIFILTPDPGLYAGDGVEVVATVEALRKRIEPLL